jgi:hypothetical protein
MRYENIGVDCRKPMGGEFCSVNDPVLEERFEGVSYGLAITFENGVATGARDFVPVDVGNIEGSMHNSVFQWPVPVGFDHAVNFGQGGWFRRKP